MHAFILLPLLPHCRSTTLHYPVPTNVVSGISFLFTGAGSCEWEAGIIAIYFDFGTSERMNERYIGLDLLGVMPAFCYFLFLDFDVSRCFGLDLWRSMATKDYFSFF